MHKIIASKTPYEGVIFRVDSQIIETPDKEKLKRDVVYKNAGAVILTINKDKKTVVLCKEHRAGVEKIVYGFPAGVMDQGELNPELTAQREVREETGYTPISTEYLGKGYSSPGYTNELIHFFLAIVEGEAEEQELDGDESIEIVEIPFDDLQAYMVNGKIPDNNSYCCFMRYIVKYNEKSIESLLNEIIEN